MSKTISFQVSGSIILMLAASIGAAFAQTTAPAADTPAASASTPANAQEPTPPRRPAKRSPTPPARVTVIPSQTPVAPQVVTIVHRLNGVKILRLLQRQAGANGVIERIDPEALMSDAHASIIAGWAMDDGKTIAARLPQAAAEIETVEFESFFPDQRGRAATPFSFWRPRMEPDLIVVSNDGKKFRAHLVGLDAATGLSVMQLIGVLPPAPAQKEPTQTVSAGEGIWIFAPEAATPEREVVAGSTYVTVGKMDATVSTLVKSDSGALEKLTVRSGTLSPDVIGGVACDQNGGTIGIVESIDGSDATIVSAGVVRAATERVLERQGNVPRPLLGVQGEAVERAEEAAFLAQGWRGDQVRDLIKAQVGILLTSVTPGTPAALAKLQPGDVILSVNQTEVKDAEQFSKLLGKAGTGKRVEFTIRRHAVPTPVSVPVTLGGSFAPTVEWHWEMPLMTTPLFGLQQMGIQAMALTPSAASQMGAQNGLIVVAVENEGAAARAGIREGDVIESVDGRILGRSVWTINPAFIRQRKHTLTVVRNREKKQIVVEANN